MRKMIVAAVAVVLVAVGCSREQKPSGEDLSGPVTRTVHVDGTPSQYTGFYLGYSPRKVTVRPGDTVSFKQTFSGEPHSVTLGTLVNETVPVLRRIGPDGKPPKDIGEKFGKMPEMLPQGPGDANQIAVNPCFVDDALPTDAKKPCPKVTQPKFTGQQAYYSSGYLPPDGDFEVPLSDDIAPGNYTFYCNLHGPMMSGTIEVVAKDTPIPSQADVDSKAARQLAKAFAPTTKAYEDAVAGKTPFKVLAGYGSDQSENTGIIGFLPKTIDAKVGEKVTWTVVGPHTISFNPPSDVKLPLVQGADGTWHLNPKVAAPQGGAGQPPPPAEGESQESTPPTGTPAPPPPPTPIDGGSYDGQGFHSSGFVIAFPPNLFSYSLTFTKAGSYQYVCLIHPAMTGTVKVS